MPPVEILVLVLLFAAVVGVIWATMQIWDRRSRIRERMGQVAASGPLGKYAQVDADAAGGALHRMAVPVARLATPEADEEITRFRAKFMNAGIRSRSAPMYFFALKVVLALGLPLIMWLGVQFGTLRMQGQTVMFLVFSAAALGYYLPNMVLGSMAARRQRDLFEAFPDAIDLMVVCIEAGLSLDMALQRAAQEIGLRSPALADELQLVGIELRIGSTRERALRNLAARTGVGEISMFVSMILQADRFGTSVADSMRVHAEDSRTRRQYRAEEAASKVPTKLLFPLLLTIFPAIMLVLVGPAVIGLARSIIPIMAGR